MQAAVTSEGSIFLGKNIVCDGYGEGRQIGVVSHFHADHSRMLPVALRFCKLVLSTSATRELLLITKGETFPPYMDRLRSLPYTEKTRFDGERITLLPAKHVLGSAQVLVETEDGDRLLYSGDFLVPGTFPPEVDILVTEATYGLPSCHRRYNRNQIIDSLIYLVKHQLSRGPVSIITYQGKLQEIMNVLVEAGVDVPFLVPVDIFDVAQIYKKYGIEVGGCIMWSTPEAREVKKDPHVSFASFIHEIPNHSAQIYISGRCTVPIRQFGPHRYVVGLSTHADLNGLLWYIRKSKAKLAVIDGARHGNAPLFARLVEKNLGVKCMVMPL